MLYRLLRLVTCTSSRQQTAEAVDGCVLRGPYRFGGALTADLCEPYLCELVHVPQAHLVERNQDAGGGLALAEEIDGVLKQQLHAVRSLHLAHLPKGDSGSHSPLTISLNVSNDSRGVISAPTCDSVDVKGNRVDVKGNGVDVEGNGVDDKGNSVDVKGNSVDVKGNSVDVKGNSVDVKGNDVDVKGNDVDVKGNRVDDKGNK
eukprot:685517-Pyramimonas_sp.AAC.1